MSPRVLTAEAAAPLLLELARAFRARQFYPSTHATVRSAVQRAAVAWRDALSHAGRVEVQLTKDGMILPDGTPIHGLGLEDLAAELRQRGIRFLGISRGVTPDEITVFVDTLTDESGGQIPDGGFEKLLRAYGVKHLTTLPGPSLAATQRAAAGRDPSAAGTPPIPAVEPAQEEASENTVELVRLLAQLELSGEPSEYRLVVNRIDSVLNKLLLVKNFVDAYRAALVYCRHSTDASGWPPAIRQEARSQLRRLHQNREMLDFVVERACAPSGLTSVQAIQVLTVLGGSAVSALLSLHESGTPELQKQIIPILITLGEEAFPAILEELASGETPRIRRAVRLLGDMQNPRGVDFLADILRHPDLNCRREAARALARIGSPRAFELLVEVLGEDPEIAPLAVSCLAASTGSAALRALLGVVSERAGRPEEVRLEAIRGLGRIGNTLSIPALGEVLRRKPLFGKKKHQKLRAAAAAALGSIGGEGAYMVLQPHVADSDPTVREACRQALRRVARQTEE